MRDTLAWLDDPPVPYGNGLLGYKPDLRSEVFGAENPGREGILARREEDAPPLAAAEKGRVASLVVGVSAPWVIAGLQNDLANFEDDSDAAVVSGLFWRQDPADENRIFISTDNGRSWKKVWENTLLGAVPFQVDLSRHVIGRSSYGVKFEWIDRKGTGKVGLEDLKFDTWVALSPMALPRVVTGKNTFRLAARPRRTFYSESFWQRGAGLPDERLENLAYVDKAPFLRPRVQDSPGVLTFRLGPIGTVEEARIGVRARALGNKPADTRLTLSLSEDEGRTWRELRRFAPDEEHEESHLWMNHVINDRTLDGARSWLRVAVENGGLEKVIANSALRAEPAVPSALRITHLWREGERRKNHSVTFPPRSEWPAYEVEAGADVRNEALKLEAVAP